MGAALGLAEIIRILAVAAFRPRRRHRALAIGALYEAAQREIIAHVPAHESAFRSAQSFQYAPMRFVSDEGLMLALHERNVPSRNLHIASIDGVLQHLPNALFVDAGAAPIQEARILIEVVFDLHLGDEPPGGEAFQHLADDGRGLWIGHEYFASGLGFLIAIADWRLEYPKAVEHAGAHFLAHLATVLLALKLRLRGDHGFDEFAFRGILEAEVQAFAHGVAERHFLTKLQVKDGVARIALQVIEYDNVRAIRVLVEIPQQPHHAGTLYEVAAAAHIIGEHRRDGVAAIPRVIAAAALLRDQALPVRCLFFAGYAAVDDGLGCVVVLAHVPASFAGLAIFNTHATLAEADDYEFQPLSAEIKNGAGAELSVRLVDKRTGKTVPGAVIFRTQLDMSPDGMGEMLAKHEALPPGEPGVYRYKADITMAGGWALKLQAKVPGEPETIEGSVVFTAKD